MSYLPAIDTGTPRALDPFRFPCLCVVRHVPSLRATHEHHVVPLSWGGPDEKFNTVSLCPTAHDIAHGILRDFQANGVTPRGNRNPYLYQLAVRGWEGRPQ